MTTFDPEERALLARLADVLIPAGQGFPSASEAGVAREGLDQVVSLRPDLAAGLKQLAAMARNRDPFELIACIAETDTSLFGVLTDFVPGAYFLNEQVRVCLKYAGQTPRPVNPQPDHDDLLQPVLNRGPVYRPTPRNRSR